MHVKKILIPIIIALGFVGLCYGQEEAAPDPPSGGSEEKTGEDPPAEPPAAEEKKTSSGGQEKKKEENVKEDPKKGPKEAPGTEAALPPTPLALLLEILLPGLKVPAPLAPVALQALLIGLVTPGINVKVISFLLAVQFCTEIERSGQS
ncbi:uncharacterized protein LOC103312612 [Tribolium castaneum]|uniref:Uncharacterized protein n=1 Tax=Tribolium castaneum TaxID=7070 RepID=D2A399_TRICA|nr:PREDICTED: uncharacterized protein LOC103312612 [Tribolium castaneum]EFA01941.1 hypothetical protein TcasGA2_TC007555 [Tribolium castaneum]|eukprot:XP_008191886.1 PREDICTED: uncharacterized protein LOC103312612 [Tribolium castaneum]